jgi:hypothetical protein
VNDGIIRVRGRPDQGDQVAIAETGRPEAEDAGARGARELAERAHRGQVEPSGRMFLDHVRRVASAVPPSARAVAWVHDALEWTGCGEPDLVAAGLSPDELAAVRLLTRDAGDGSDRSFLEHVLVIARAGGRAGHIARTVKRADSEDRARHPRDPGVGRPPPYARARALLAAEAAGAVVAGEGCSS